MTFSRRTSVGLLAALLLMACAARPAMSFQDDPANPDESATEGDSETEKAVSPQEEFPSTTVDTGEDTDAGDNPGPADFLSGSWMYILIAIVLVVGGGLVLMKGSPPAEASAPASSDPEPAPASAETVGSSEATDPGDGAVTDDTAEETDPGAEAGEDDTLGGGSV